MAVLITREEEAAAATAARVRAVGYETVIAPLTSIVPIGTTPLPAAVEAVLFTSPAAARCLALRPEAASLLSLPVLAVGDRSAEAAMRAGFTDVSSASGNGEALAALAASTLPTGIRLLYPAAAHRARDLGSELAKAGFEVLTVPIYEARAATAFPEDAVAALGCGRIDAVLHYSRRAAAIYLALAGEAGIAGPALAPRHLCLAARVAEPLTKAGACLHIAASPDEDALLALLGAGSARLVRRSTSG